MAYPIKTTAITTKKGLKMFDKNQKKYLLLGTSAMLLIGAFIFGRSIDFPSPAVASDMNTTTDTVKKIELFPDDLVFGDTAKDVKVTVLEYASMTCPHCAKFHITEGKALREKYAKTKGVKFIYRDYPLDGIALRAAQIARCDAKKQQAFVDIIYAKQANWIAGTPDDIIKNLKVIGRMGGLSDKQIEGCLNDSALASKIAAQRKYAADTFVINATPTIIINGTKIEGEKSFDEYDAIIQKSLDAN